MSPNGGKGGEEEKNICSFGFSCESERFAQAASDKLLCRNYVPKHQEAAECVTLRRKEEEKKGR